jgi:abhydrolase domain-containing protein 6
MSLADTSLIVFFSYSICEYDQYHIYGLKIQMKKLLIYLVMLFVALASVMALFPEKAAEFAISAERSRSGLSHKVIVIDDETWHYLEGGPNDAEVLLLIHGFGGDKDNWTRYSKHLTDEYRVIALDLPGFGESARHVDWDYSLPSQYERVNEFVKGLGLEQFHIVGNSMGGHLAALYTLQYASKVRSVGLFDSSGVIPPNASDLQIALEEGRNPLVANSAEEFGELIAFVTYEKPFIPWPLEGVLARRAMNNAEFNRSIFKSLGGENFVNLDPMLADIERPVLILWGENDRVLDVSSIEVMRPLLPDAEVVIMKETGHLPMIERPAETAEHYLRFLEKL